MYSSPGTMAMMLRPSSGEVQDLIEIMKDILWEWPVQDVRGVAENVHMSYGIRCIM